MGFFFRSQRTFLSLPLLVIAILLAVRVGVSLAQHGHSSPLTQSGGTSPSLERMTHTLVDLNAIYQRSNSGEKVRLLRELATVAAERHKLLSLLMDKNPGEILRLAIPSGIRANMPSEILAYVEEWVEIEGVAEVLHEDRDSESRYLYFLETPTERLSLHFSSEPLALQTGSRIRVQGVRIGNALAMR